MTNSKILPLPPPPVDSQAALLAALRESSGSLTASLYLSLSSDTAPPPLLTTYRTTGAMLLLLLLADPRGRIITITGKEPYLSSPASMANCPRRHRAGRVGSRATPTCSHLRSELCPSDVDLPDVRTDCHWQVPPPSRGDHVSCGTVCAIPKAATMQRPMRMGNSFLSEAPVVHSMGVSAVGRSH